MTRALLLLGLLLPSLAMEVTEASAKSKPIALSLVETGRRTLAGRPVVDLAVEIDGKRADQAALDALGLGGAPFPVFTRAWSLLLSADGREAKLLGGDGPIAEAGLKEAFEAAVWRVSDAKKKRPGAISDGQH